MQMLKREPNCKPRHCRSGLAPVELTLSLPIMLFVMGLMIIVGTAGAWKVRTETNSRQAVNRTLWPRDGGDDPHPIGWPNSAVMEMRLADDQPALLDADPFAEHSVVRGPEHGDPQSGNSVPVRIEMLDMLVELKKGVAEIDRDFPVLANMPPRGMHLALDPPTLDSRWQFQAMGLPRNRIRRVKYLYPVDLSGEIASEIQRYVQAATAIVLNPLAAALAPLDRDDELPNHTPGNLPYSPPYGIGRTPDYHLPGNRMLRRQLLNPERVCAYNPDVMRELVGNALVADIQRLPSRMTRDFLRMYRGWLSFIERAEQALDDPSTPPEVVNAIQQALPQMRRDKAILEGKIEQLEQFAQSL
jgi:hypothetical protein